MTSATMKNLPGYSAIPEQTERMIQPSVSPHQLSVKLDMYVRVGKAHIAQLRDGSAGDAGESNSKRPVISCGGGRLPSPCDDRKREFSAAPTHRQMIESIIYDCDLDRKLCCPDRSWPIT